MRRLVSPIVILLIAALVAGGCGLRKPVTGTDAPPQKKAVAAGFRLVQVDVPGPAYGYIWPEDPPFSVRYIPEPAFVLTFDRPLAAEQKVRPFYIQWGNYIPIHPAGSDDPYYGGPAADVYKVEGERLTVWAAKGGLPMGVVMVVVPRGWRAADGSVLQEDVSFLVSRGALSPHKRLSELTDPDERSDTPLLWRPREPGGPPVGYALKDGAPVASEPGGPVIRRLKAGNSFVLEPDSRDGWRRITYYTPAPGALEKTIPATANVYADRELTAAHSGWVPAEQIGEIPLPANPASLVVVGRSGIFNIDDVPVPYANVFVPPSSWWPWPLKPPEMRLTPEQVNLLEFYSLIFWDDLPGSVHTFQTVQVNNQEVSTLDPRAHPVLLGVSDEEYETFRRARRRYLAVLEDMMRSTRLAPLFMPYRDLIIETVLNGARLEDAWLEWIREDRLATLDQLLRRLRSAGLQPPPGPELEVWFKDALQEAARGEGWRADAAGAFARGRAGLLQRYRDDNFYQVQTIFDLLWETGSLVFEAPVRVTERRGDGRYVAELLVESGPAARAGNPIWLIEAGELEVGRQYLLTGQPVLDRRARDLIAAFQDDWTKGSRPIIQVKKIVPAENGP